jgi:hypothetical protein
LGLVVAIVAAMTGCGEPGEAPPKTTVRSVASSTPDIVLILSDTHRLDHLSGFAPGAKELTPNIATLMRDGVTFTEAYSPVPISAPAYASLLTGLRPVEHGLLNNQQHLGPDFRLLQESLQDLGYRTAAVIGNPFCSSAHGFGRGFDSYWDQVDGHGKEGEIITGEAIRWLDSSPGDTPFFLFAAYMDAHTPYIAEEIPPSLRIEFNGKWLRDERAENAHIEQRYDLVLQPGENQVTLSFLDAGIPALPPDAGSPLHFKDLRMASGLPLERTQSIIPIEGTPYERINNRAMLTVTNGQDHPVTDELVFRCFRKYRPEVIPSYYKAGIQSFDQSAGRLIDHLRDRGLYDRAVIIFVSDHGEMLGEHQAWGHVPHLFQETIRVPLVIKAPGLDAGIANSTPLDLTDLHGLVLDLATGDRAGFDGVLDSAGRATLLGATYPPEAGTLQASAIRANLKVILTIDGEIKAFDLETDPHEEHDIYPQMNLDPRIEALVESARDELTAAAGTETLDLEALSEEERDRLRALGYLDSGS